MLSGLSSAIHVLLPFPKKRASRDVCVAHALAPHDTEAAFLVEDGSMISMLDGAFNLQERQVRVHVESTYQSPRISASTTLTVRSRN
jgi:hypothetical protein